MNSPATYDNCCIICTGIKALCRTRYLQYIIHVATCIIYYIFIYNVCTLETRKKYLWCARFNFLLNKNRSAHSGQIYATVESSHMCSVKGRWEGRGKGAWQLANRALGPQLKQNQKRLRWRHSMAAPERARVQSEMQNCGRRLQAAPKGAHKSFTLTYHRHTHIHWGRIQSRLQQMRNNKTKLPRAKAKAEARRFLLWPPPGTRNAYEKGNPPSCPQCVCMCATVCVWVLLFVRFLAT